jgi:hypothetical protein
MKSSTLRFFFLGAFCAAASLPATLPLPTFGQSALVSPAPSRIVAPIDETNLVPLRGNVHPLAQAKFDRGSAPGSTPTGRVMLVLQRSAAQQQALTQYLSDLQNPGSPNFHHWLTPAQYGARFSIADSDLQAVESWLQSQGFTVQKVPQARNVIQFSGTFDQIQNTFHTAIHTYATDGQKHFANASDPQIPAALAPVIAGVGPLNDFHPHPNYIRGPNGHWNPATHSIQPGLTLLEGTEPFLFVDPADAATIYDTPNTLNLKFPTSGAAYDGTGVTIGIAGDADITSQDIANYRTAFLGETSTNVNLPTVVIDGNDPGITGDSVEALLDNEVAGGLAPGAKIIFYASAGSDLADGLFNAIFRAIDDNTVSILNISFGECEAAAGSTGNLISDEAAAQAAAQGISVTVSAGDGGSAGCDNFDTATYAQYGLAVNAFASTPYTIAVGGTDFDTLPPNFSTYVNDLSSGAAPYYGTASSYIPESPWNNSTTVNGLLAANQVNFDTGQSSIVGGGGGVSSVYAKPAFQTSLTPNDNHRDLPDVSLFAANGMYSAIWVLCSDSVSDGITSETFTDCANTNGQFGTSPIFEGVGGTSAAAPAFAGMLALVEQKTGSRLGQADAVLYQLAKSKYSTVFHDITTGNNSVFCLAGSPNCGSNNFLTGYNTATGYDLASGLGSVDASAMVNNWSSATLTATSTTLTIDNSTAAVNVKHGTALTFATGVTPSTSTGDVAIVGAVNENASGPANNGQFVIPLTSGAGSATYNGLPGGTYTVTASYSGDASDASSTSSGVSVTISPESSTTTLLVDAYNYEQAPLGNTAIPYGSYVFLNAIITGTAEGSSTEGTATGTVAFSDGSNALGTANVGEGNQASYPPLNANYSLFPVGAHSITAKYSGDASFNASSTSAPVAFTIVKAPMSLLVTDPSPTVNATTSSPVNVVISTPVNVGATPTGTVNFIVNGKTVGSISGLTLSVQPSGPTFNYVLSGSGLVPGSALATGANTVTVTYTGDANYAGASSTVSVTNTTGLGSFTLTNSGNVSVTAGSLANAAVTITPAGGFQGPITLTCATPTGFSGTCLVPASIGVNSTLAQTLTVPVTTQFGATPGTYALTVKGVDSTGKITSSTAFSVVITAIPNNAGITLSNSGNVSLDAGTTNSAVVTIQPKNGYIGSLNLTCAISGPSNAASGGPTCALASTVSVTSTTGSFATLTLGSTASTVAGAYTITVTAADRLNASITGTTTFTLTVIAPPPVPAIALTSSGNISVSPGATTSNTATLTVTPSGGFTGAVDLSCKLATQPANANDVPICTVPASVTISGTAAATATMTVATTAATTSALTPPLKNFFLGGGAALAMVLFFGIPARRRAWRTLFGLFVAIVLISGVGCSTSTPVNHGGGGQSNPGTTAGTYTFTVAAMDHLTQQLTSTTTVTVIVQ